VSAKGWATIGAWGALLAVLYLLSHASYPIFHTVTELFSIVVATAVFLLAWNTRHLTADGFLVFLGTSYLFVGAIDLAHTLAYRGIHLIENPPFDPASEFWIAARALQAVSLVVAPATIGRRVRLAPVFAVYAAVTALLVLSIVPWDLFPVTFVQGRGLTPFKIASEYVICVVLVTALYRLCRRRDRLGDGVFRLLVWAVVTTIVSELSFTLYVDVYGLSNFIGHYLKIVACYLLYVAVVETGLRKPYDLMFLDLKRSEEALKRSHDELEAEVADRTAEIRRANAELERSNAELLRLTERSHQLAAIVESSEDAIIGKTLDGTIVSWNAGAERLYGYSATDMIGRSITALIPGERQQHELGGLLEQVGRGDAVTHYETERITKDGGRREVSLTVSPIRDRSGAVVGASTIARDVTEQNRLERAAMEQFELAEAFFNHSTSSLVILDRDYNFVRVNEAYARACRRDIAEFAGRNHFDMYPSDAKDLFDEVVRTRRPFEVFARPFVFPDQPARGVTYWDWTLVPILGRQGEVEYLVYSLTDVTDRQQSAEKVRAAALYARGLIEASLDPLVTIAPEGRITDVNRQMEIVTGLPRADLIGSDFSEYFTEPARARQGYQRVLAEGVVRDYPLAIRHASGRVTEVSYNATVFRDESGAVQGVFAAARDVSEWNRAQDALRERTLELERSNAELARFAEIAAHDLQEPLRSVVSFVQLLARHYRGRLDAGADEYIGHAVEGATRMQQLIKGVLEYLSIDTQPMTLGPASAERAVTIAIARLEALIAETEGVVTHDALPTVVADRAQLADLFEHLIGNALKFRGVEPPRVHVSARRLSPGWTFSVSDNGIGIDPEHIDRLFTFFRRLHGRGQYPGLGAGLAISKKIVERHGGRIWVASEPGKGSTFHFSIPSRDEAMA
jgi:PAS domain S-box-containing protein